MRSKSQEREKFTARKEKHMGAFINLSGKRFGRVLVLKRKGVDNSGNIMWECICECGTTRNVRSSSLRDGSTVSCGCYHKEMASKTSKKHGMCESREYRIWEGIIQRCLNPKNKKFSIYGGRGITVCSEWRNFINFHNDMGPCPSVAHSIERRLNDEGYHKDNCYWATHFEQNNNTHRNRRITWNNKNLTVSQWARELNAPRWKIYSRLQKGLPLEEIFNQLGHI